MIYVLNKNKIISCAISIICVFLLLIVGSSKSLKQDAELIKVSSNNIIDMDQNYIKK